MKPTFLIIILFFLFCSSFSFAQLQDNELIIRAEDSLKVNPNYSKQIVYRILGEESPDAFRRLKAYSLLGQYFNEVGQVDSAIHYGNILLKNIEPNNNSNFFELKACLILGLAYTHQGVYNKALNWYLKGFKLCDGNNFRADFYRIKSGMATNYAMNKKYDKALPLFEECLEYKEQDDFYRGTLINIGNLHYFLGNYNKAEVNYKKALEIANKHNDPESQSISLLNIGDIKNNHLKKFDEALHYYRASSKIASENGLLKTYIKSLHGIGTILFKEKKNYSTAESTFKSALSLAEETHNLVMQKVILSDLEKLYIQTNDLPDAYQTLKKYEVIKDSMLNISQQRMVNEMEVKYETLQREKELEVLKIDQKKSIFKGKATRNY